MSKNNKCGDWVQLLFIPCGYPIDSAAFIKKNDYSPRFSRANFAVEQVPK